MKRFLCVFLLAAAVFCLAGCAEGPIKTKAETSVTFYSAPKAEEEVLGSPAVWNAGNAIEWRNALTLRKYVNAVKSWTDDNAANREPFEFIGEFMVKDSGRVFFFTEDGTLYYDHFYGRLSDEGREFLMGLKPGE